MAVFGDRILRCSQGHLYTSSETARLAGSIHLGPKRLMYCPLCQKMRMTSNVPAKTLTPQQFEEASQNRY